MVSEQLSNLNPDQIREEKVGEKTVAEWDNEWVRVENGFKVLTSNLKGLLGLYRATLDNNIKYIGDSVEINQGLQKRLRDYSRESNSARDHFGAKKILEHIEDVKCDVIVVGIDEQAAEQTETLKRLLIRLYNPEWNAGEEEIAAKRRAAYAQRSPKK